MEISHHLLVWANISEKTNQAQKLGRDDDCGCGYMVMVTDHSSCAVELQKYVLLTSAV